MARHVVRLWRVSHLWRIFIGVPVDRGRFVLEVAALLLDLLYWFTRQTTTGISSTSVYSGGLFKLASIGEWMYTAAKDDLILLVFLLLMGIVDVLPSMMGIWAFIPFEVSQTGSGKKTWSIRHKQRSHRERQSERLESWKLAGGVSVSTGHPLDSTDM